MSLDPTKNGASSSSQTNSAPMLPSASAAGRKRLRLPNLTPAGMLRQKKKRGGGNGPATGLASARRLAGIIRSGPSTPKPRTTIATATSLENLAVPNNNTPETTQSTNKQPSNTLEDTRPEADEEYHHVLESTNVGPTGNNQSEDEGDTVAIVQQSKDEIKEMWDQMTEEQRQRYDVYRRTALNKGSIKKLASSILNQQVSPTLTFVLAGFAKVFVGEIVERAVVIQMERGDQGALKPEHLREAYRLYKKESTTGINTGFTKRLF